MWGFIYFLILTKIESIFKSAYKIVTIQKPTTQIPSNNAQDAARLACIFLEELIIFFLCSIKGIISSEASSKALELFAIEVPSNVPKKANPICNGVSALSEIILSATQK